MYQIATLPTNVRNGIIFQLVTITTRFWFDTRTVFAHVKKLVHGQTPVGSCEQCGKLPVKNQPLFWLFWACGCMTMYNYSMTMYPTWAEDARAVQSQATWEAPVYVDKDRHAPKLWEHFVCEMNLNLETPGWLKIFKITLNPDTLRRRLNAYFKSFRQNSGRKIVRISCC